MGEDLSDMVAKQGREIDQLTRIVDPLAERETVRAKEEGNSI